MRIIGLGNDLVDIRRIEKSISRFDGRFISRVFTEYEINYCRSKGNEAANFAKRFAAKEACSKALGTGIDKGVFWKDMAVENDGNGKPFMKLSGGALDRLKTLTPPGMSYQIDLTITDEHPMAQAIVILTALGEGE
ncbi:MAG: holo-ACP synthase [Kordiimonadaceae bacterium]|jgi:holo-[acyl-carrier protein] synthase|nr:holo-ACP synthase [Kordiimonadaceae bacterium]MBT6035287.1 holo-ACP synthase [Kordiimonadaceae bacterium]MBT6328841.1 holo-ACP synthase [Kordiimonadaceae bacterium]MBT7582524.1 holo-ACP synthase [Kordiimonadaceae bacterium]